MSKDTKKSLYFQIYLIFFLANLQKFILEFIVQITCLGLYLYSNHNLFNSNFNISVSYSILCHIIASGSFIYSNK